MKKFKILGIISITIIIVYTVGSFTYFCKGVSDGWNHAEQVTSDSISNKSNEVAFQRITVRTLTPSSEWEKVPNSAFGKEVPYQTRSIITYVKPSHWYNVISFLVFPLAIGFFYGFYCLINFLISVARRKIFTGMNVHRMRWFSYSYIAIQLYQITLYWIGEQAALTQISLPGYELIGDTLIETDWISMIVIILFTEIFAMGTKIKEEQDLTI